MSSPRFFSVHEARRRHFLGACYLCKKPIAENKDVFMYSKECRWEQMDMDEALENESKKQPFAMKGKPSLIIPSNCDKNRYKADAAAVVAG
ncbi:hypothetical protein BHM03_00044362 [Ensete ventricosum]|nr:hypothetical protein BHM03_00044362 [Ensete ventricosum]